MSAFDLGCVKTQKFEKRRELFFSDRAKANPSKNCRGSNCDSEKRSFYRRRAPLRFYTAKTQSGHGRLGIAAVQMTPKPHFAGGKSLL
jgi:hypothetical protein